MRKKRSLARAQVRLAAAVRDPPPPQGSLGRGVEERRDLRGVVRNITGTSCYRGARCWEGELRVGERCLGGMGALRVGSVGRWPRCAGEQEAWGGALRA